MPKKVSTLVPNKAGENVRVYGELESDTVFVWVANGPQIGGFNFDRFGGKLTADSLRTVLFGN